MNLLFENLRNFLDLKGNLGCNKLERLEMFSRTRVANYDEQTCQDFRFRVSKLVEKQVWTSWQLCNESKAVCEVYLTEVDYDQVVKVFFTKLLNLGLYQGSVVVDVSSGLNPKVNYITLYQTPEGEDLSLVVNRVGEFMENFATSFSLKKY